MKTIQARSTTKNCFCLHLSFQERHGLNNRLDQTKQGPHQKVGFDILFHSWIKIRKGGAKEKRFCTQECRRQWEGGYIYFQRGGNAPILRQFSNFSNFAENRPASNSQKLRGRSKRTLKVALRNKNVALNRFFSTLDKVSKCYI